MNDFIYVYALHKYIYTQTFFICKITLLPVVTGD